MPPNTHTPADIDYDKAKWFPSHRDDLVFGAMFVIVTCYFCQQIRNRVLALNEVSLPPGLKRLILEFILTVEVTVYNFETTYILPVYYPFWLNPVILFIFNCYQRAPSLVPGFIQADGNPIISFLAYLKEEIPTVVLLARILVQLLGASVTYVFLVSPVWSFSAWWKVGGNLHLEKINERVWVTSVLAIDPRVASLTETGVPLLFYLTKVFVEKNVMLEPEVERYTIITTATAIFSGASLFLGGAYANPAVATVADIMVCEGVGLVTKVWVFWISPLLGISLGAFLEQYII